MTMEVLTVGLKMVNEQNKVFIMRYICSKNWTIPSSVISGEDLKNDTACLKSVFKLVPSGVNVMSLNKITCVKNEEIIKAEDGDESNNVLVQHNMMLFEALVEATGEQSLLDVPLKFDYAQWMPLESLIHIPFTNRITKALIEYEIKETPSPKVLSGIM